MNFEPNKDKFDFAIDNFHSLQVAKGIVKPRVKVTLYIENENIYFKEFDGPYLQGKKLFSFIYEGKEIEHNTFVPYTNTAKSITLNTEGYDFSGLEVRLEAETIAIDSNQTVTFVPTISNPANNLAAQSSKTVPLSKNSFNAVRGKLFFRTSTTQPWEVIQDTTYYLGVGDQRQGDNIIVTNFSNPVFRKGEVFSLTLRYPQTESWSQYINFLFFPMETRTFGIVSRVDIKDGSYTYASTDKVYAKYIDPTFTSSTLRADGKLDDTIKKGKEYTIEFKPKVSQFYQMRVRPVRNSGFPMNNDFYFKVID